MYNPKDFHWLLVKRILRYLKVIVAYNDADWAGCPDTRRSTTGYCVFLGTTLISWTAKKQQMISRSSAESEYRALAVTVAEVCWIQSLLNDLQLTPRLPIEVHCDNISATSLAINPVNHTRTKHLEVEYVRICHISTQQQLADIFTKSLLAGSFCTLRNNLGITTYAQIEGG